MPSCMYGRQWNLQCSLPFSFIFYHSVLTCSGSMLLQNTMRHRVGLWFKIKLSTWYLCKWLSCTECSCETWLQWCNKVWIWYPFKNDNNSKRKCVVSVVLINAPIWLLLTVTDVSTTLSHSQSQSELYLFSWWYLIFCLIIVKWINNAYLIYLITKLP